MRRLAIALAALLLSALSIAHAEPRSAGPIWNDIDARNKCPRVCGSDGWDGNWRTTVMGRESVCNCGRGRRPHVGDRSDWDRPRGSRKVQINAGPIWHNGDAQAKCPRVCGSVGRWDGNWRTVGPGASTCDCVVGR